MYAVIRRYRLAESASIEELMARVHRGFVPIVARVPGFVAFHAIDLGEGRIASVSVFDGRDAAEESTRRAADHIAQELAAFFAGPPEIEHGVVRAPAVREGAAAPRVDSGQPAYVSPPLANEERSWTTAPATRSLPPPRPPPTATMPRTAMPTASLASTPSPSAGWTIAASSTK